MRIKNIELPRETTRPIFYKVSQKIFLLLLFSLLAFITVISIDANYNSIDYSMLVRERDNAPFWKKLLSKLIAERRPVFNFVSLFRMSLIIFCSIFTVISIVQFKNLQISTTLTNQHISASRNSIVSEDTFRNVFNRIVMWVILFSSLSFLTLFMINPVLFSYLGNEDQPIEVLSAIFYFVSCGLFIYTMFLLSSNTEQNKYFYLTIAALFSFGFFILGMEEISWFQRVFSIETPEAFQSNLQNEMNLHNFYTNPLENAFYFASFVFLILIPFVNENILILKENNVLSFFIPSRFIVFTSAIFVAYNYDMWNIVFIQLAVFITFFILAYYTWLYLKAGKNAFIVISIFAVFTITQILFIAYGDNFVRLFDVTEYKELFIPIGFCIYSLEVFKRIKSVKKVNQ